MKNKKMSAGRSLPSLLMLLALLVLLVTSLYAWQQNAARTRQAAAPAGEAQTLETGAQPTPTPTPHDGLTAQETEQLNALCDSLPYSLSVCVLDIDSGDSYLYNNDGALYYAASLLKAPYALWLCRQADEGLIDLDGELPFPSSLWDNAEAEDARALAEYVGQDTLPTQAVLHAMIANSDNTATSLFARVWPGEDNFGEYLLDTLDFAAPETCRITGEGITGMITAQDMLNTLQALYDYFESDAPHAALLQQCFTDAPHEILYVPEGVTTARKYGSWEAAFHDIAIVYDEHPYLVAALSSWGTEEVDFPPEAVEQMQKLGRLVNEVTQDRGAA